MSADELAVRRPVWVAMSYLFLDTDVRHSYESIVRVLAESPFTIDELDKIYSNEVAPVLASNLLSVAGEWAGFDEEWLVSSIAARLGRRFRLPGLLSLADEDWAAVRLMLEPVDRKR